MGQHRRFTAEEKLSILKEAQQPGVSISEVCRRHGVAPSVFYRWRAVAEEGSATALKREGRRAPREGGLEAQQKAEIERLRTVVAEITAEKLELMRVPAYDGQDSGGMADTIPAAWRTVLRPDGGHFGGRSGMLSAMISERGPRSP